MRSGWVGGIIAFWLLAAWVTSMIVAFKTSWLLLVIALCVPPVAFIHGTGVWFGQW